MGSAKKPSSSRRRRRKGPRPKPGPNTTASDTQIGGNSLFQILPNELVSIILTMLEYRDLATCMRVCKRMRELVDSSSLLQYHLELGRSGMVDGPMSTMSTAERREKLQVHLDAWGNLQWSDCVHLFDTIANTFVMHVGPGGILAIRRTMEPKITFYQLPSKTRGIALRKWEHSFPFRPSACALDPHEDILVLLKYEGWRLHFFSLRNGGPHPLAASPFSSRPPRLYRDSSLLQLVVSQSYVAALIPGYQLKVYNWKTGHTLICITSPVVRSVVFLPGNRILLGATRIKDLDRHAVLNGMADGPVLVVYNLDEVVALGRKRPSRKPTPAASFALEFGRNVVPVEMFLRYRLNVHSYSPEVAVPFVGSFEDQMVALQAINRLSSTDLPFVGPILRHTLLIPITTLLHHISSIENGRTRHIQWEDWGTTGTRRAPDSPGFAPPSPGSLSGSRFLPRTDLRRSITVWDFGRAHVWQVQTSLSESVPFVRKEAALPSKIMGGVDAAISEDAIVICEARNHESRVYLLVF